MRQVVDEQLLEQAGGYALRFSCDDCIHFDSDRGVCSLGYPAAPRRASLVLGRSLEFCKEFDLGVSTG